MCCTAAHGSPARAAVVVAADAAASSFAVAVLLQTNTTAATALYLVVGTSLSSVMAATAAATAETHEQAAPCAQILDDSCVQSPEGSGMQTLLTGTACCKPQQVTCNGPSTADTVSSPRSWGFRTLLLCVGTHAGGPCWGHAARGQRELETPHRHPHPPGEPCLPSAHLLARK